MLPDATGCFGEVELWWHDSIANDIGDGFAHPIMAPIAPETAVSLLL